MADPVCVRLLLPSDLPQVPLERVFRSSVISNLFALLVFASPVVILVRCGGQILAHAQRAPMPFWFVAAPLALAGLLLWLLVLQALFNTLRCSLLPSNWILRVSSAGIGIQLRSYQNAHFRQDVPTVIWLETSEVARGRVVQESYWITSTTTRRIVSRNWLELELQGVDLAPLEARLDEERRDPGPEMRVLGIRTHVRSGDVPVFVAGPNRLRVQLLRPAMVEALREQVEITPTEKVRLEFGPGTELEPRVRELYMRGQQMIAADLVRRERGVTLVEAKKFVEDAVKKAA